MVHLVHSASIVPTPWSDHDLVLLSLAAWPKTERHFDCKCNDAHLKDPVAESEIADTLRNYFQFNVNGEVRVGIVWEAAKATLRGTLIGMGAARKGARKKEEEGLQKTIFALESELSRCSSPSGDLMERLEYCMAKLRDLQIAEVERHLWFFKQYYYEKGA